MDGNTKALLYFKASIECLAVLTFYLWFANLMRYFSIVQLPLADAGQLLPAFTMASAASSLLLVSYEWPDFRLALIILTGLLLYFAYLSTGLVHPVSA